MATVRLGPITGLIGQFVLLGTLAATVGLGAAGWAVGSTYALVTYVALARGLWRSGADGLGPADWVTMTRSTLVGGVAALTADAWQHPSPVGVIVTITVVALVLDAVDGQVARRTGTVSPLGARFDMEVDAFLILVLSVYAGRSLGWWVLGIGLMRYAFLVAGWLVGWMRRPVLPRYWRKVVAATQAIVLVIAAAAILPTAVSIVAVAGALVLLCESFGRDLVWQWQQRVPAGKSVV